MNLNKLILLAILILFLSIRLIGIKNDMTNSDGIRWHERSEGFISALVDGDFAGTYQKYHPGVTLMWLVGGSKFVTGQLNLLDMGSRVSFDSKDWYPTVDGLSKTVLVLTIFILFTVQLLFLTKIFGYKTSLLYGFLMSVEPYLIGIDRWLHLTSLETYLVFTAFIVLLYSRKTKYVVLSAILFGLAALTKISALILLPIFLYMLYKEGQKSLLTFLVVSLATFCVLFPALLVSPVEVLGKMFKSGGEAVDGTLRDENALMGYLFYPIMLFSKLGLTTSVMFLVSIYNAIKIRVSSNKILIIYFLTIFLGLTVAGQKIDRYIVGLIPIILLFIALNIGNIRMVVLSKLVETALVLYLFFPVMSAYINYLPNYSNLLIKNGYYDNSGEYFNQAAAYLNTKEDIRVYVPNNFDIFNVYFRSEYSKTLDGADYMLLSLDIDRPEIFIPTCTVDKEFGPVTYKSVFVYKCDN